MIDIIQELKGLFVDAEDLAGTFPEVGAASAGYRLGFNAGIKAIRARLLSREIYPRLTALSARSKAMADSDNQIVAALTFKLASLRQSRYMTKNTGPSEYRQAGEEKRNATPNEDMQIALLESILRGEG